MPKAKKGGKKGKKGAKGAGENASPPLTARTVTVLNPLDGTGGSLGVEHLATKIELMKVAEDLIQVRLATAVTEKRSQLNLTHLRLHDLPADVCECKTVTELTANNNFLVDIEVLRPMAQLVSLDLSCNLLSGVLSDALEGLVSLTRLVLDDNMITGFPAGAANLRRLQHLSIKRNCVQAIPPECALAWSELKYLDCSYNQLQVLPEEIGYATGLERLVISDNRLTALPATIGRMVGLVELRASNNLITEIPEGLASCTKLRSLHLGKNAISVLPPQVCSRCTALEEIHLHQNKLAALPADMMALVNLKKMTVSNNEITEVPPELGTLVGLEELYMCNNGIASLPPTVSGWIKLHELSLRGTKLKELPQELFGCAALRHLDLRSGGKKETCKLPADLALRLPQCVVQGGVAAKAKKGGKSKK